MTESPSDQRAVVAIVDDEPLILEAWSETLGDERYRVHLFSDPFEAKRFFEETAIDVALLDVRMPGLDGIHLLGHLRERQPRAEAIMITGHASIETAVRAIQMGAYDFLCKPVEDLNAAALRIDAAIERRRLRQQNARLESKLSAFAPDTDLIGDSLAIQQVRSMLGRVASSTASVLVCGESGTGKELAARFLHTRGDRKDKPFVAVNCAAIAETLIDSELFGHERGAFTGANQARKGLFEAANGGVLFLDEIGDVPLQTQVKLLRVLQEGEVRAVGSTRNRKVDARVVAATNRDLESAMRQETFRKDLFYRISTFRVDIPPLRERAADVVLIAGHLLGRISRRRGSTMPAFSDDAMAALVGYHWPGNVRELSNVLEHAATLCEGCTIEARDLPTRVVAQSRAGRSCTGASGVRGNFCLGPYAVARRQILEEFEQRYLSALLAATGGNLSEAARRSGIDRTNLRRMVKRYGLALESFKQRFAASEAI